MLLSKSVLLALAALTAAQSDVNLTWVPFDRSQFNGSTALDTAGHVQLFWKTGTVYSTFGIASQSEGYLGLGFSETGAMTGADMAIAYKDPNGTFVFENRHALGFQEPDVSPDQTNNVHFKEGGQSNGVTYFVFDKKNTVDCLDTQTDVLNDSWQWFIYAFSDSNTFAQHADGHMGKQYVKLGTGTDVALDRATSVDNAQNFTVIQPELTIPTDVTTYCYTLHKMPAGKKNFIIGERPNPSSSLLHHQVLYACYGTLTDDYMDMIGKEANCNWQNFSNPCNGFVTEWAPGMSARTFEPGYGKPFGEDLYEYAMLEVHYNNPEQLEGMKDTNSYTFLWTDQPVATEIGTLTLGSQVTGWSLDPGKELASRVTVCAADCTENWPSEGITAVAVFHHMHYRGVNAQIQVIRDGKEITPLSTLRDFDYGYQFSKNLNNIKLLPGDQFITTCQYNTMNDTEPVLGGFPSQDEMCFAWVDYYPANDVILCTQADFGYDASNPVNGTYSMCSEKTSDTPTLTNASTIISTYEHLPATGVNCTESSGGTTVGASILQTCPETDVCFSLNVPQSSASSGEGDIFFQLSAPVTHSWVALGQGTMMSNANIFVMYSSADGKNVTLSPRTTSGHVMPTHNAAVNLSLLEGSGIADGKMVANVRCSNCNSWSKGTMSLEGGSSDWVYASLQGSPIASDDVDAAITQHDDHGTFQWDLSKATGGSDANPFLGAGSSTTTSSSSGHGDQNSLIKAHGALASIAFIAIFPIGAILVRLANLSNLAWIHGGLQMLGYAIFTAAAGIGISLAKDNAYLQKPHAVIGLLLLVVLAFMPLVGAIQHRMYKKVQRRTVWSYGHIFTGRVAVVIGIINGGLGLRLADAVRSEKIAYGFFAGLVIVVYVGAMVLGEVRRGKEGKQGKIEKEARETSSTESS